MVTEGVAAHGDVDKPQRLLARRGVFQLASAVDEPRAGGQDRQPSLDSTAQWLGDAKRARQLIDGARLAAGQNDSVQPVEILRQAHPARFSAEALQHGEVFLHPALQREHADEWSHRVYQPRSAKRCGAGMSLTLMPTMASPRPRLILASSAGWS